MYTEFYGFSARPFDLTPDPRYLVTTDIHREALSNLEYAILSRKGITLLVGEAGTGKTTVIRAAIERQPARVHCVHIHNPALTRAEFVTILGAQFALSDVARTSKADMLLELERLLRQRQDVNETSVLVVDEAQSLPFDLLDEIRLLTNIETNSEKLLSLVIAGQPEIAERFNDPSFRQLKQRIALRCELRPLNVNESVAYIAGRIRAAGGVPSHIFTREAVLLIHEYSGGIPRTINVIADNALLGGLAAQQKPVGMQLVRDVCRDFDIAAPAPKVPRAAPAPTARGAAAPTARGAPAPTARGARPLSASEERLLDSALPEPDRGAATAHRGPATFDPTRGDETPAPRRRITRREKIANWAAPAMGALGLKRR
jgi:type II secretory pathway predicted ATPase ExeA